MPSPANSLCMGMTDGLPFYPPDIVEAQPCALCSKARFVNMKRANRLRFGQVDNDAVAFIADVRADVFGDMGAAEVLPND